jgi:UDP-N-acetylglucosamine kinase
MQNDLSFFSQEELTNKFNDAWQEMMTYTDAVPQKNKIAFVLGGQPGAGKSSSIIKIKAEFLNNNAIFISGDDFRKYHPQYDQIEEHFHEQMHEYTSEFASKMVQLSIDKAMERNYNIVVEGTFRTTIAPSKTLEQFKNNNYQTGIAIVVCQKELSWQSATERHDKERKAGGNGRAVSKEAHDYVTSVLATNAQAMYQSDLYDNFLVYKRSSAGTELVYNHKYDGIFDKKIIDGILKA